MARVRNITTMGELSAALMASFNAINKEFYGGTLEKVIITVKESGKKNAFGWIEVKKNWQQNGKERHEINISADYIGQRTVTETIGTLMHEMAHLYNLQKGIKDCTRSGLYHNKKFKEAAEAHGLTVTETQDTGYSFTTPNDKTVEWIKKNINIKSFAVYKNVKKNDGDGTAKPKQSMRKLVCPNCGNIARITKDFKLICGECMCEMK